MEQMSIYLMPLETKNCVCCGKEISTKWEDDLCENCGDDLLLAKWDNFSQGIAPYKQNGLKINHNSGLKK